MIGNINSLISGTGTAADRSQLVEQLARRVDVNRDGQVTSAEFTSFLSGLMKSLDEESDAAARSKAPAGPATSDSSAVLTTVADAAGITRAQGAAMLRQALDTISRAR